MEASMFNILIVEDDRNTLRLMDAVIKSAGYKTFTACDGAEALNVFDTQQIDLLLVDVMMPNMDGYTLTRTLRSAGSNIPILMISAKHAQQDKNDGFIVGIDDYMTKPVDEEELLLRIKALMRRSRIVSEHKLTIGQVELDYDSLTVKRGDFSEVLPKKEFELLYKLLSYPGVIFTRFQLMDEIWGMDSETDEKTVNVHINRLRNRFENFPEFEIVTIRGLGYKADKRT